MLTVKAEVDFLTAVYDFIVEFSGIDDDRVFRGNQSRAVFPDNNEFCVFTPILRQRRATNRRNFSAVGCADDENGTETATELVSVDIQIDFYGENADRRAQAIETAARSHFANEFFEHNNYDVRCAYATNPQNLTAVMETAEFVERWSTTATFTFETELELSLAWFEDIRLSRLVNVDVKFKP